MAVRPPHRQPWAPRQLRPLLLGLTLAGPLAMAWSSPATAAPPPAAASPGPAAVAASAAPVVALEPLLEPLRRRHGLPALAAALVVRGEIVAAGAVGVRRIDAPTPVTRQDRFHIGSDTKAMTALLAAMAVERGRLRWQSPLAEVFPELAPSMAAGVGAVTLRQLLSHSSGIGDPPWAPLLLASRQPGNLDALRRELVRQLVARPLLSPAGSRFHYGNANYVLAAAMLERLQGRTWEELIQEQLFAPLGLRSAGLGPQSSPGLSDAPLGHRSLRERLQPMLAGPHADNPPELGPAGLVHLSVLDFARWAGWNAGGGRRGPALVSPQTLQLLQTPVIAADPAAPAGDHYALGWVVTRPAWAPGPLLHHMGSNTMNLAGIWVDPQRDVALVLTTNRAGPPADAALEELAPLLHARAASWLHPLPPRSAPQAAPGRSAGESPWPPPMNPASTGVPR
ncbi:MAG: serine hydrolase domain-containing protein [Synechococcaceae cyanobacterium]|nr:serine hydrolase domain-containing protein [Synechococcaceae cyanobacterium]